MYALQRSTVAKQCFGLAPYPSHILLLAQWNETRRQVRPGSLAPGCARAYRRKRLPMLPQKPVELVPRWLGLGAFASLPCFRRNKRPARRKLFCKNQWRGIRGTKTETNRIETPNGRRNVRFA